MTLRLFATAVGNWDAINAECIMAGVKLRKLGAADLCDVVHFFMIRNCDEKEARSINMKLYMPPPGVDPEPDHPFFGQAAELRAFEGSKLGKSGRMSG